MPLRLLIIVFLLVFTSGATHVEAQEGRQLRSPVLVVDFDRLFSESDFGIAVSRDFSMRGADLATENRKIESELIEEEKSIAAQRPTMPQTKFRALADSFDAKVQSTRTAQINKATIISQSTEKSRSEFLGFAKPALEEIMVETGAAVILERASVFLSNSAVDITDDAIQRVNLLTQTSDQDTKE